MLNREFQMVNECGGVVLATHGLLGALMGVSSMAMGVLVRLAKII